MRLLHIVVSIFALVLVSTTAFAQVPGGEQPGDSSEPPPLGVLPPLSEGLYTDLSVGAFFTMNVLGEAVGRTVSNAQPYVGIGLGYDVTRNMVAGASFGYGASAGVCFDPGPMGCAGARSFSVIMLNGYYGYLHDILHQWYLGAKVMGGMTLMTPEPVYSESGGPSIGFNGGLALTTEYHTHLEHFVLGLDVAATFVMGGRQVQFPGVAIYPRLKYVF